MRNESPYHHKNWTSRLAGTIMPPEPSWTEKLSQELDLLRGDAHSTPLSAYPGTSNASTCGNGLPPGYTTIQYGPYANFGMWCRLPWRYKLATVDAIRTPNNPNGDTTTYTVDANGNVTSIRPPRGTAAAISDFDTTQTFDNADTVLSTKDAAGDVTSYNYDQFGNRTSMTDPRGNVTTYTYDAVNRLTSTQFTRGPWPTNTSTVPPACRESTSSDAPIPAGRILCSTTKAYDGVDNLVATQDPNHQTTTTDYDGLHRATDVFSPPNSSSGPSPHIAKLYDSNGNVTATCDPREFTEGGQSNCPTPAAGTAPAYGSAKTYDALDRVTSKLTTRSAGVYETTNYSYDADGNQTSTTDPNNHTTSYSYNNLDRKISMTVPRDATDSFTTFWTYDASGDTTSETQPGSLNLGTGTNGQLVIDGTAATSSTTRACPQTNPCQFPTDLAAAAQGGNYTNVVFQNGGWLSVAQYNGSSNGSITFQATQAITICATCGIVVSGDGPIGGSGGVSVTNGNGHAGGGDAGGGGGAGATFGGGGGGAGHLNGGARGSQGTGGGTPGNGGGAYGSLAGAGQTGVNAMGSGGGGGGYGANSAGGIGGAGGGAVHLTASSIDVEGSIYSTGGTGGAGGGLTGGGGGGGGSGGSVWLTATSVNIGNANSIVVSGGPGGSGADSDNGGAGSVGSVRFDSDGVTGPGANGNSSWSQQTAVYPLLGRVTSYSYDNDNRLTDTVTGADSTNAAQAGTDGDGTKNVRTRLFYDQDGNVVAKLLPGAFASSVTSPDDSYMLRTDYDTVDRPVTTFTPRYDPSHPDQALSSTQSSQCSTSPRISPASIPDVPAYPSGTGVCVSQASYDPAGNLAKAVLPTSNGSDNRNLAYTYTDDNLVSSVQGPNPASNGNQETVGSYLYDADAKRTSVTDANGNQTTTAYFPDESVSQTAAQAYTPAAGATNCESSTQVTHVTSYAYNADGQVTQVTDPCGHTNTTGYTNDDLVASQTVSSQTNGANDLTTYGYDPAGNQTSITSPSANAKDATNPSGTPTSVVYTYDNLVSTMTEPVAGNGSLLRQTGYTYDQGGRKTSETVNQVNSSGGLVSAGGTQSFSYFNNDRMATQAGAGGGQITYGYNPAGSQTSSTDSNSGVTISSTFYLDELPANVDDGGRTTAYTYDGLGQTAGRSEIVDGKSTSYPTTYVYNDAELPSSLTSSAMAGGTATFSFDPAGRATKDTLPNGDSVTRSYNPDDTLISQVTSNSADATVASYSYNYNNNEQITSQAFSGQAGTGGSLVTPNYTYGYDAANRLQTFTDQTGTNNIIWDHNSNRLGYGPPSQVNLSAGTCNAGSNTTCNSYNADNSIASSTIGTTSYASSYSARGDLQADPCATYTYDGFDRLTKATESNANYCPTLNAGQSATYTYDGLDRQHSFADGTTSSATLHYDGITNTVADETNPTTGIDSVYGLSADGNQLSLTQETPVAPTTQYLTSDGFGNISTVTSTSGSASCTVRYDAFGSPEGGQSTANPCDTGSTLDDYFYRGARRDSLTGQYQFGSRIYDPSKNSFLTSDHNRMAQPSANVATHADPLTEDTYTYVNGDPVNFEDTTGYDPWQIDNDPRCYCTPAQAESDPVNQVYANAPAAPYHPGAIHHDGGGGSFLGGFLHKAGEILGGFGTGTENLAKGLWSTGKLFGQCSISPVGQCWNSLKNIGEGIIEHPGTFLGNLIDVKDLSHGNVLHWLGELAPNVASIVLVKGAGALKGAAAAGDATETASLAQRAAAAASKAMNKVSEGARSTRDLISGLAQRISRSTTETPGAVAANAQAGIERSAVQAAAEQTAAVRAGEAGSYASLQTRSVVGDELAIHHMPQAAAEFTSRAEGGALAMPQGEHLLTRTYGWGGVQTLKEDLGLSFRDVLAKDIWDVRSIAGSLYNPGLLDLIHYYRSNFPQLMDKGDTGT